MPATKCDLLLPLQRLRVVWPGFAFSVLPLAVLLPKSQLYRPCHAHASAVLSTLHVSLSSLRCPCRRLSGSDSVLAHEDSQRPLVQHSWVALEGLYPAVGGNLRLLLKHGPLSTQYT